jgi:hypothetical protein
LRGKTKKEYRMPRLKGLSCALVVLLPLVAGCVQTQVTRLHPEQSFPRICPEGVALFTSADKVGQPYVEVAVLSSTGDQNYTSQAEMYNSQRKKAAEIGANGIILGQTQEAGTGAVVAQALIGTPANRRGQATAIYIEGDSTRVQRVCKGRPTS